MGRRQRIFAPGHREEVHPIQPASRIGDAHGQQVRSARVDRIRGIRGKRRLGDDVVAYQLAINIDLAAQAGGGEIENQPLTGSQSRRRERPIPPRHALIISVSRDDVRWRGRSACARRRLVEVEFFDGRRQRHADAGLVVEHRPPSCRRIHRQVREFHVFGKIEGIILPGRFWVQPQPPSLIQIGGIRYLRPRERDEEEWQDDTYDGKMS